MPPGRNHTSYSLLCCHPHILLRLYTFPPTMVLLIYKCLLTCRLLEHNSCIFKCALQSSTKKVPINLQYEYWYGLFEVENSSVLPHV